MEGTRRASIYLFITLSLLSCHALPPSRNIYNFSTATWNTNGPRWSVVAQFFMLSGLDVLALQEAGGLNNIVGHLSTPATPIPVCYAGFELDDNLGLREHVWTVNGQTYYLYYYDHRVDTTGAGPSQGVTKQNMAIVSRYRADEIIIIPADVRHNSENNSRREENEQPRTFINRPVIGIRISNSVFLNIHPEPNRNRNEAPLLLAFIESYMRDHYPTMTWMVMGDFNRTPAQLRPELPQTGPNRFIGIAATGRNTRVSGELDYAVVGGPAVYQPYLNALVAALATLTQNPSDHKPVRFN